MKNLSHRCLLHCCSVAVRKIGYAKSKITSIFIYIIIYIHIAVFSGYGISFRELQHCNAATAKCTAEPTLLSAQRPYCALFRPFLCLVYYYFVSLPAET